MAFIVKFWCRDCHTIYHDEQGCLEGEIAYLAGNDYTHNRKQARRFETEEDAERAFDESEWGDWSLIEYEIEEG
jgi:hypothetical protein